LAFLQLHYANRLHTSKGISRSSKVLERILGKTYGGTIVGDFFSAYIKYANKLQQFCLAHLIRDMKFLTTLPNKADKRFGQSLLTEFKRPGRICYIIHQATQENYKAHSLCFSEGVQVVTESDGQHLVARSDFHGLWEWSQEK